MIVGNFCYSGSVKFRIFDMLRESSDRRLVRYREALGDLTEIGPLIDAIEHLYAEDRASGHLAVLTELTGGIASNPELRAGIEEATSPWLDFVEERIRAVADGLPFGAAVPAADLADLVFSVVVGIELRSRIDGRDDRADRLFRLADLVAAMVASDQASPTANASSG